MRKLFIICCIMLFLVSCSQEKERTPLSQNLRFLLPSEPSILDPNQISESYASVIVANTFEPLVMIDKENNLMPAAAESWEIQNNNSEYIFHLRKDAKWSNGDTVTASDFKNSFMRIMITSETNGSYLAGLIKNGQAYYESNLETGLGIEVLDEFTLKITTESPTPFFLEVLTFSGFVPVHNFVQDNVATDWAKNPDKAVSNGPFKLVSYEKGKFIRVEKNPYYWDAEAVKLDSIDFMFRNDNSDMMSMYTNKVIDGIYEITPFELKMIPDSEAVTHMDMLGSTAYIAFNHESELFRHFQMRQVIALALDRDVIVEDVLKGAGIASSYFVPFNYKIEGVNFRDYTVLNTEQNLNKARTLLQEMKEANVDTSKSVNIYYKLNGPDGETAQFLSEQLNRDLGLNTQAKGLEWDELYDLTMNGAYDLLLLGWVADYPHPLSFLGTFGKNGVISKMIRWYDTSYDLMADAFFKNLHSSNSLEHLRSMEDIILNGYHIVPLYYRKGLSLIDWHLKDWYRNSSSVYIFKEAYFDQ
ncbi:MAG: peptide ABC transporter substrate-binding protein [Clostridia bacterium]|nr:peptide ABC transporter substrate-binding protein [Clostridia bacterium]